ncbi:hypothetical protein [Pseudomonas abyssi]|uniref:hypothetical protein n=1 Tax=Pseudomonas abyssi TaxID=170540 RepID=UPI003C7A38B1
MDNALIQIGFIIVIGIGLFAAARLSRRSHEKKYGTMASSEKIRFLIVFSVILVAVLLVTVVWPVSNTLYNGVALLFGLIGALSTKPSLTKDIMYSAAISSFIAIFTGWAVHGM